MAKHRIMILGAAGQIGQSINHVIRLRPQKPDWEIKNFSRTDVDLTNPSELRDIVQTCKPDLIMNCAGLSGVDVVQKQEMEATKVNFHAVATLAGLASSIDVPLIHLSTDHVFDGRKETPYLPNDQMNPLNKYGATKMMGEEALRHELAWHVILRVSAVFSAFRRNMLTQMLKSIETQDEIRVPTDLLTCPTPGTAVGATMINIAEQILSGKTDGFGTFHYAGQPACTRFDFAKAVMETYAPHTRQRPTLKEALSVELSPCTLRPANAVLDCAKIREVYGIEQPDWRDHLGPSISALVMRGKLMRG